MLPPVPSRKVRFVGGHFPYADPPEFNWECQIVSRLDRGIVLETLTDPPRTIRLAPRYRGRAISAAEKAAQTCSYELDDGDRGMATWTEDEQGNVTVKAFDYPG